MESVSENDLPATDLNLCSYNDDECLPVMTLTQNVPLDLTSDCK